MKSKRLLGFLLAVLLMMFVVGPVWAADPTPASINLTVPNGGENRQAGSGFSICWNYSGVPGQNIGANVKIELYKGGVYYSTITSSAPISNGSYYWLIPSDLPVGNDYKVKVSDTVYNINDSSDNDFSISLPPAAITVKMPYDGEILFAGTNKYITWSYSGIQGRNIGANVKVELYKGGVYNTTLASSVPINSSYFWSIPSSMPLGNDYKIKVTDTVYSNIYDFSDKDFTISLPTASLTVTAPNGGETLIAGSNKYIWWSYSGIQGRNIGTNVNIELYKGGVYYSTFASSIPIDGSYYWTIPSNLPAGNDYKIKVSDPVYNINDSSNNNFTISTKLNVVSPNGGEAWVAGTAQTISWSFIGTPGSTIGNYVQIELLKNGTYQSTITAQTSIGSSGSGSYTWQIPSTLRGTGYQIKVTDTSNSNVSSTSNAFNIFKNGDSAAVVSDTIPTTMEAGKEYQVSITFLNDGTTTWTTAGQYYLVAYNPADPMSFIDPFTTNTVISLPAGESIAPGQTKTFNITMTAPQISGTYHTSWRMESVGSGWFGDYMAKDVVVPVPGELQLTTPNGGETWQAGTTNQIQWTYTRTTAYTAQIELYQNGVIKNILGTVTLNSGGGGSFDWVPMYPPGSDYTIVVKDITSYVSDGSDAPFSII